MGDPRKTRKHFKRPLKIWDKANIEAEKALKQTYGLKNKKEIWRTETLLRKKRQSARSLLALPLEERLKREQQLLNSLGRLGIMDEKAALDDVLTLNVESFLERRLQTLVWRKGLANTASQARQFITHGHISIGGKKVDAPGYIVKRDEENKVGYYGGKKMILRPPVKEKKVEKKAGEKKGLKEEFEEAKPKEEMAISPEEAMKAVREARAKAKAADEGKAEEGGEKEEKAEKKEHVKEEKREKKEEGEKEADKHEKKEGREKEETKGEKKAGEKSEKGKKDEKPAEKAGEKKE